ncbi:MAG: FliI/YscN family ATPase [Thioalkalivibrionaceae bacterium]
MANVLEDINHTRVSLQSRIAQRLIDAGRAIDRVIAEPLASGRLVRMVGMALEAEGLRAAVGAQVEILRRSDEASRPLGMLHETSPTRPTTSANVGRSSPDFWARPVRAEVVGFAQGRTLLMPEDDPQGLRPGLRVKSTGRPREIPTGDGLLGRVIDADGSPLDGLGPLRDIHMRPLFGPVINPLQRQPVREPLATGVRAIDGLLTLGRGQRMGLFAGSGVGKSVLLGMLCRGTDADVVVIGLIGERGREVREFLEDVLDQQARTRAVVVAVPADRSPLARQYGAWAATAIAEAFRDQGRHVLLLVDSLTRFAQGAREVAMAVGEPPATKGYAASVFARLPRLVERAGNGADGSGSITALYTVLAEGDDHNDPIVDAARAILDGHIVLSRSIAEGGRYPAIDVGVSVSRVMTNIVRDEHRLAAAKVRAWLGAFEQNRDLITVGAYRSGSDSLLDEALRRRPLLDSFLSQDLREAADYDETVAALMTIATTEVARGH